MLQPKSGQINYVLPYRPPCTACGVRTVLTRIEPSDLLHHDIRFFDCPICANVDSVVVKFR
jgi:hypothetical protein